MRALATGAFAAFLMLATILPSWAVFQQAISVPPRTVSVTVVVYGTTNGQVSSSTTTQYCPAGDTITVTIPSNTSTTTYGASGAFYDGNGDSISAFTIIASDGACGGGGGKHMPGDGGGI